MKRWLVPLTFLTAAWLFIQPPAPAQSPNQFERAYRKAWQLVADNYYRKDKLQGWSDWQHAFDGRIKDGEQLRDALHKMLSSLDDEYTYVLSAADVAERTDEHGAASVVHCRRLRGNQGYIKIDNLCSRNVRREFHKAVSSLNGVSGFVIDLRNNHGGFISNAQQLFAMMAEQGTFMSYRGRSSGHPDAETARLLPGKWRLRENGRQISRPRQPCLTAGRPLVVLVNEDTRSAAEMLAGALRDNHLATIVGTRTYGKGVLQNSYSLPAGIEIKVVTARYFLPDGANIHSKGINPDLYVESHIASAAADEQLQAAARVLDRDIARAGLAEQHAVAAAGDDEGIETR